MSIRTNDDIKQARDYGTQAFRAGFKCEPLKNHKLIPMLAAQETVEQRLELIDAWTAGWTSAQRAEFI